MRVAPIPVRDASRDITATLGPALKGVTPSSVYMRKACTYLYYRATTCHDVLQAEPAIILLLVR